MKFREVLREAKPATRLYVKKVKKGQAAAMEASKLFKDQRKKPRSSYSHGEEELDAALLGHGQYKITLTDNFGKIVGALEVVDPSNPDGYLVAQHLGSTKDYPGIGEELVRRMLAQAARKKVGISWSSSRVAVSFYKKLGFSEVSPNNFSLSPDEVIAAIKRLGKPGAGVANY